MNPRIVITGASSDIGLAIAERIVRPGDRVVLHCFRHDQALAAFAQKRNMGGTIARADFTDKVDLRKFCTLIKDTDILINAAAYTKADLLPNLTEGDITAMLAVNIRALIEICRAVLPGMLVRRNGIIVNLSSVTAQRANRGQSVYAGTKGFVESFTRGLTAEYGGRGLRFNCVAPGAINAGSLQELLAFAPEEVKKYNAMQSLGTPADVAAAVAFLISPDSRYINGQCLAVAGGFMRGV
jgi:3-oxoacyl-[acyl-carrier protein] reductase